MLKRLKIQIRQIHKRRGFLLIALAAGIIALAILISSLIFINFDTIAGAGLVMFSPDDNYPPVPLLGGGLNIKDLPDTNIVRNPSFEPDVFMTSFTLEDGSESYLTVHNKHEDFRLYDDDFLKGADIRVTAERNDEITTVKTAKVKEYLPNYMSGFTKSPITGDIPGTSMFLDVETRDEKSIAVGENGIIIYGVDGQSPKTATIDTSSDIVSITSNQDGFYVCTANGDVFASRDGLEWYSWQVTTNISLASIAASMNVLVAVGDAGQILTGYNGSLYELNLNTTDDFIDIFYVEDKFTAITNKGNIFTSCDGMRWKKEKFLGVNLHSSIYVDSIYMFLTGSGDILILSDLSSGENVFIDQEKIEGKIISLAGISRNRIFALTDKGDIRQSSDMGDTWEIAPIEIPDNSKILFSLGTEDILVSSGISETYISKLVTKIVIDTPLISGKFMPGQTCYITHLIPKIYPWQTSGEGGAEQIIHNTNPEDGLGALSLSSSGKSEENNYTLISQKLLLNSSNPLNPSEITRSALIPGEFYLLSLKIRQETITKNSVKVWLSGGEEVIGTEFKNIGTTWNKYSFKFYLPREYKAKMHEEIRLNIGITGEGLFHFDEIYLGLSNEFQSVIPADFNNLYKSLAPSVVRMSWLKIGDSESFENGWVHKNKLETGLNLIETISPETMPWIVIDSYSSQSEIRNLLEYIGGPISSEYGLLRHKNGSSLPWAGKFKKIFIEFTDYNDILENDLQKAMYVNSLIKTVENSPYYNQFKNHFIFVDGMVYEDGIMLSRGDYYGMDFVSEIEDISAEAMNKEFEYLFSIVPRNLDKPSDVSFSILKSLNLDSWGSAGGVGDYIYYCMENSGDLLSGIMLDFSYSEIKDINDPVRKSLEIIFSKMRGNKIPLTPEYLSGDKNNVAGYAFENNDAMTVVIISQESKPVSVSVDIPVSGISASYVRYSAQGQILREGKLKRVGERINLMPGDVLVIDYSGKSNQSKSTTKP